MNLKDTYNKIALDWNTDHANDKWWKQGTDKFISLLKPSADVLDVGCGSGIKSKYFAEHHFKVTGIDFSEKMIEIAKEKVPSGVFKVLDLRQVDTLEDDFGGVYFQAALLHIPKAEAPEIVKKLASKLRHGGYLYIATKEVANGVREEVVKEEDYGYEYERFFSYYTLDELKHLAELSGCEIVSGGVSFSGRSQWIEIIARKV